MQAARTIQAVRLARVSGRVHTHARVLEGQRVQQEWPSAGWGWMVGNERTCLIDASNDELEHGLGGTEEGRGEDGMPPAL